jgi:transposase
LRRAQGKTYREIRQIYGVQPGTACDWWGRYQAEGEALCYCRWAWSAAR